MAKLYIKTENAKGIKFKIYILIFVKVTVPDDFISKAKELHEKVSKEIFSPMILKDLIYLYIKRTEEKLQKE